MMYESRLIRIALCAAIILLSAIPGIKAQAPAEIYINEDIQLVYLQDSIFIHKTWHNSETFGRFSSNGLIIVRDGAGLMVDTPMDNDKTHILTRYLEDSMSVHITKLIIGHFHDDCLGGLDYLQSIGVESVANSRTVDKCMELGLPVPSIAFADSLQFTFNGELIECRFFGAGHSFDNIIVWLPDSRILFGGCLVRAVASTSLGNLSDAVVDDWDTTIEKILHYYNDILTVIPGHGDFGDEALLYLTIELVRNARGK